MHGLRVVSAPSLAELGLLRLEDGEYQRLGNHFRLSDLNVKSLSRVKGLLLHLAA